MGVFDKLKNVFFEEEYVEVEEPIKKPKKEKQTIAKKIDLPEMPKVHEDKSEREKEIEEEVVERVEKRGISERELRRERNESGFKFPMTFEDDDFTVDEKPIRKEQPVREREQPKRDHQAHRRRCGHLGPAGQRRGRPPAQADGVEHAERTESGFAENARRSREDRRKAGRQLRDD